MNKDGLFLVKKEFFPFFSDVLKDVYNFFQKHTLSNMNDDIIDKFLSRLVSREESNSLWNLFQIACFELNIFEEIQISYLHIHFIFKKIIFKIFHANMKDNISKVTRSIKTKDKVSLRNELLRVDLEAEAKKISK